MSPRGRMGGMTAESLREILRRNPFEPFRLVMLDGKSYEIRRPEIALLTRTVLLVGVNIA